MLCHALLCLVCLLPYLNATPWFFNRYEATPASRVWFYGGNYHQPQRIQVDLTINVKTYNPENPQNITLRINKVRPFYFEPVKLYFELILPL